MSGSYWPHPPNLLVASGGKLTQHSPAKVVFSTMPGMSIAAAGFLAPLLTPHGHLLLVSDSDAPSLPAALQQRLTAAFALGSGQGLLQLGAAEVGSILPPAWAWWRDFAARYVTAYGSNFTAVAVRP